MRANTRLALLAVGLVLGLMGSAMAPACIIPDYCIVVQTEGSDWCVRVEVAHMWPIGQPELAQIITDEYGSPVKGCGCFNDGEVAILGQHVPPDEYAALVEKIEHAARTECAWVVPPGYDHDCFVYDNVLGPLMSAPFFDSKNNDCVGSCAYINEPPHGSCGDDPNPWECNDLGSSESGDSSDGTTDTGTNEPDDAPIVDGVRQVAR